MVEVGEQGVSAKVLACDESILGQEGRLLVQDIHGMQTKMMNLEQVQGLYDWQPVSSQYTSRLPLTRMAVTWQTGRGERVIDSEA